VVLAVAALCQEMGAGLGKSQTQAAEGKGHEVYIRRICIGRSDGPGNGRCASAFSVQLRPSRFVRILYGAQRPSRAPPDAGRARARRRQREVPRRLVELQRKPSGYMFLAWRCRALALSVSMPAGRACGLLQGIGYRSRSDESCSANIDWPSSRESTSLRAGKAFLDRELVADKPADLGRGFGADVRDALDRRRQWLVEQDLAAIDGDTIRYHRNLLSVLQLRELRSVAGGLAGELEKPFVEARTGQSVEGTYRRAIKVGDARFALIERSRDFTLVPWRPVLERETGKAVSGIVREGGISWTIGRSRGLGIS
jgi:hypothetical protein